MKYVPFWVFKSWLFQQFLYHVYYRIWCPRPIGNYSTVRDCIASGNCGCNNNPRIR